jgi:hypothetical protein
MRFTAFEKRVRALEQVVSAAGKQCVCRHGRQTAYHNAEELKAMMDIGCPVHGFRDLGDLRWQPSGLPLQSEDRILCTCPPSPVREFLQGGRGALTGIEHEEEERRWGRECSPDSDEEFRCNQVRAESLLNEYYNRKRWRN